MGKSKIDWCDETINIFTGCNGPHGVRCPYCYAHKMAKRLAGMPGGGKYRGAAKHNNGDPFGPAFHKDVLNAEIDRLERARKPRRVFIGSMGDMCFEGPGILLSGGNRNYGCDFDSGEVQKAIANFCTALPQHTFHILTKRPDLLSVEVEWPSNVWLGVSVSRGEDTDRIATLLDKKAVGTGSQGGGRWHPHMVLWASVEPLLDGYFNPNWLAGLGWVVIGAQTGNRQEIDGAIIRAAQRIVNWCAASDTPCFAKDNMRQADPDYDWPREFPK